MNLVSKSEVKNLFKKYRFLPLKRLGQNFLIDKRVLKKIIEAAELSENDIVLEIGPGIGNLTQELAKKVKKIIAIEKDRKMIEILKETLKNFKNVEIINQDILEFPINRGVIPINYKVIANLPFYLTAPVIRKFLENMKGRPSQMVLMIQKEVAQRICAKPPEMSILAISVQFYARPEIISYVLKKSFWPSPKVNSAIIKIIPYINKYTPDELFIKKFFQTVKAGFSQPRKQILNNLSKMLKLDKEKVKSWLLKNDIQPGQRAETLKINDWAKLTRSLPF